MGTKYASEKRRFYTFHPGIKFELDYTHLLSTYEKKCYLVALSDTQIAVLQNLVSSFLRWQWVWGLPSPRSSWTLEQKQEWDNIEAFNACLESALMCGNDISQMNTHLESIATSLSSMDGKITPEKTLDDVITEMQSEDGESYKFKDYLEIMLYLKQLAPSFAGPLPLSSIFGLIGTIMQARYRHQMLTEEKAQSLFLRQIARGIAPISDNDTDEQTLLENFYEIFANVGWFKIAVATTEPTPVGETAIIATLAGNAGKLLLQNAASVVSQWFTDFLSSEEQVNPQDSIVGVLQELLRLNGGVAGQHQDIQTVFNDISTIASDNDLLKYPNIIDNWAVVLDVLPDDSQYKTDPTMFVVALMILDYMKRLTDHLQSQDTNVNSSQITNLVTASSNYKCNASRYVVGHPSKLLQQMSDLYTNLPLAKFNVSAFDTALLKLGVESERRYNLSLMGEKGAGYAGTEYTQPIDWIGIYNTWVANLDTLHSLIVDAATPKIAFDDCREFLESLYPVTNVEIESGVFIDDNLADRYTIGSMISMKQLNRIWTNDISQLEIDQYGYVIDEDTCGPDLIPNFACFPRLGSVYYGTPANNLYDASGNVVVYDDYVTISSMPDVAGAKETQKIAITIHDAERLTIAMSQVGSEEITLQALDCNDQVIQELKVLPPSIVFDGLAARIILFGELVPVGTGDQFSINIKINS